MRSVSLGLALATLTVLASNGSPQQLSPPADQTASSTPERAANELLIPEGTEVVATAAETVSSKTAAEGDPVNFRVEEDVLVNGAVVIAHGSLIKGAVSQAERAGHMGRAGKLNVRLESTTAIDGTRIRLRAAKAKSGDDKVGATVALTVLFGPLGLLKKGKEAILKEGAHIPVFVDVPVKVHSAVPEASRVATADHDAVAQAGIVAPVSESGRITSLSSKIRIITEPPGAYIYVGDVRVGETVPEGAVIDLPTGTHSMRIRKTGYAGVNRELVVAPNAEGTPELTLEFELSMGPQQPKLGSAPVPATGRQQAKLGPAAVPASLHVGTSDDPIRVSRSLVRLIVAPDGADVLVANTHVGTSSEAGVLFVLQRGRSRCMVTKPGYLPLSRTFVLDGESTEQGEQRVEMRLELDHKNSP